MEKGVGVFNGDTGILREINTFAETATVEFDERRFVEYSFKQLDELELAYAITIHKAQGSEYPAVIIPLLGGPKMLMNRNLLYTAVTRARKCVTLVGDEKTFEEMENNRMEQSRYTTLDLRIKGEASKIVLPSCFCLLRTCRIFSTICLSKPLNGSSKINICASPLPASKNTFGTPSELAQVYLDNVPTEELALYKTNRKLFYTLSVVILITMPVSVIIYLYLSLQNTE